LIDFETIQIILSSSMIHSTVTHHDSMLTGFHNCSITFIYVHNMS